MRDRPERIHANYLFPALAAMLLAQPVLATLSETGSEVLALPLTATLVAGIWSLDHRGRWFRASLAVGLGVLLALAAVALTGNARWMALGVGGLAALGAISVGLGVRWLFGVPRISVGTLLSALSVYLLMGITFGLLHIGFYVLEPDWYHGVTPTGRSAETAELIYFSLGTLTTSAYGDILPMHPVTQLLCNVESMTGQLYLVVVVAILVSGYAADSTRAPS